MIDRPPTMTERALLEAIVAGRVVEVRCCCEPRKLVGWILLPDTVALEPGVRVSFLLQPELDVLRSFGVSPADVARANDDFGIGVNQVELELAIIQDAPRDGGRRRLALKAEHVPIEVLRRVASFVELTPGHEHRVLVQLGPAA